MSIDDLFNSMLKSACHVKSDKSFQDGLRHGAERRDTTNGAGNIQALLP